MTIFERLYEKLGIPDYCDESKEMDEVLKERLEQIEEEEKVRDLQKQAIFHLKRKLKKNKSILSEDCLAELEQLEKFSKMRDEEKHNKRLAPQVGQSVLLAAFIAYPFIMISIRQWRGLMFSVLLALFAAVYLAFSWRSFMKDYKKSKETLKEGFVSVGKSTAWITSIMLGVVFLFIGIEKLQNIIFVPEDYILYQFDRPYLYGVFFMEAELLILFLLRGVRKQKIKNKKVRIGAGIAAVALNAFLLFAAITGVTVCTPSGVTRHTFYNVSGTTYSYKSVAQIDAGFKKKGDFYYKLRMKDGSTIQIDDSVSNQFEVTYEEYLALDQIIMKYKPIKETSTRYIGNASLDTEYLEILKKALNNK